MLALRTILAVIGLAFAALIIWAGFAGDFWSAGPWLFSRPWGIVTFADLYFGFLLAAVVIALFEKPAMAALWIIPIPFLGNVWIVIWFVLRLPEMTRRLAK